MISPPLAGILLRRARFMVLLFTALFPYSLLHAAYFSIYDGAKLTQPALSF